MYDIVNMLVANDRNIIYNKSIYNIKKNDYFVDNIKIISTIRNYIDEIYEQLIVNKIENECYETIINNKVNSFIDIDKIKNLCNKYNVSNEYKIEPVRFYMLAVIKGNINAMILMGDIYNDICVYDEAIKYYTMAYQKGYNEALLKIGYVYEKKGEFNIGKKYYLMAINKEIYTGYFNLGNMYHNIYEYIWKCIEETKLYNNKYILENQIKEFVITEDDNIDIIYNDDIHDYNIDDYDNNNNDNDKIFNNYYDYNKLNQLYEKSYEYYKIGCDKGIEECMEKMIDYYKNEQNDYEIDEKESELIIEYSKLLLECEPNENKKIIYYKNDNNYDNDIKERHTQIYKKYEKYIKYNIKKSNINVINEKYEDISMNYAIIGDNKNALKYARLGYKIDKYIYEKIGNQLYVHKKYNSSLLFYDKNFINGNINSVVFISNIYINYLNNNEKNNYINKLKIDDKREEIIYYIIEKFMSINKHKNAIEHIILYMSITKIKEKKR